MELANDGLTGFAGDAKDMSGNPKASTIGGLLGKTVFVTDLASFKSALLDANPLTIVVAADIDCQPEFYDLRIASNKTIIGSYGAKTLTDPRLRTDDYFQTAPVSNNIILKNLMISVANREDVVAVAIYGSRNVWIDHTTFTSSLPLDLNEVGKFVWVNHSNYASADPDYVTLSYNKFYHRYWGVAFGAGGTDKNRATVMLNSFDSVVHRAPQLGNGRLHVLNNYLARTLTATNNDGYSSINAGAGSHVYSDSNRFEGRGTGRKPAATRTSSLQSIRQLMRRMSGLIRTKRRIRRSRYLTRCQPPADRSLPGIQPSTIVIQL